MALGLWLSVVGAAVPTQASSAEFPCPRIAAPGDCGDGGSALRAGLARPADVAARSGGGYTIADAGNSAVRVVSRRGRIRTLRGGLRFPSGVAALPDGRTAVADSGNDRIVVLDARGRLHTVAGGAYGFGGDGGPATRAALSWPLAVAVTSTGSLVIADTGNNRVREVRADGTISTLAGTGVPGHDGDGGPPALARLDRPVDVAALADGRVVVATADGRLRQIGADGSITTLAVGLAGAPGLAAAPDGGVIVTEPRAHRVLRLGRDGSRTVIAAAGRCGTPALQRAASAAGLAYPARATVTPGGDVLVADAGAQRIVRIAGGTAHVDAGAGLLVPAGACRGARTARRLLKAPGPPPTSSDADYDDEPTCFDRAYWEFNLAFLYMRPGAPRVRHGFRMFFAASRPVRIHLSARRGRLVRKVPSRGSVVRRTARFHVDFPHGLPRPGRYRIRLSATANGTEECLSRVITIRR